MNYLFVEIKLYDRENTFMQRLLFTVVNIITS